MAWVTQVLRKCVTIICIVNIMANYEFVSHNIDVSYLTMARWDGGYGSVTDCASLARIKNEKTTGMKTTFSKKSNILCKLYLYKILKNKKYPLQSDIIHNLNVYIKQIIC